MTPRVLVVEHTPTDPPALLGDWLDARGLGWDVARSADGAPALDRVAAVVSLGSERAAYETGGWVPEHVAFLRGCPVPVLGLCFGAQALGVALGGVGRRAAVPELGWVEPESDVPALRGRWLSWHYDEVLPPPGATVLARTAHAVQAFAHGPHVGVQFHPEATGAIVRGWLDEEPVQAARDGPPGLAASLDVDPGTLRAPAFALFDWWWARLQAGANASGTLPRTSTGTA